MITLDVN